MNQEGGKAQFYGKKSSIMVNVPLNVKVSALYSYKLKDYGFKGGKETGWKRAKQLSTKSSIAIQDVRYIHAWYARHVYTSYPSYKKWLNEHRPKETYWFNKRGILAWQLWGGNAGFNWINSQKIRNLLTKTYNKEYKKITKK